MPRLKQRFAASTNEAAVHAACRDNITELADYIRARNPEAAEVVRTAIYDSLTNLILFPNVGRLQTTEGVRKLVTRKYSYLIYYTVDEAAEEVVVLSVKHSARERDHSDA